MSCFSKLATPTAREHLLVPGNGIFPIVMDQKFIFISLSGSSSRRYGILSIFQDLRFFFFPWTILNSLKSLILKPHDPYLSCIVLLMK